MNLTHIILIIIFSAHLCLFNADYYDSQYIYYDDSEFNPELITGNDEEQECTTAYCDNKTSTCYDFNILTHNLTINENYCASDQYCSINDDFNGICRPRGSFIQITKLYPGQACDVYDILKQCAYGPRECSNGICTGIDINQACSMTADCQSNLYCDKGICTAALQLGRDCTFHDQCGRTALCFFSNSNSLFGVCMAMFTIDSNSTINLARLSPDGKIIRLQQQNTKNNCLAITFEVMRFQASIDPMLKYLCKSGYINTEGYCSDGVISINKGLECKGPNDCQTSSNSSSNLNYAYCKCGFNPYGKKFCDIMAGDDLWIIARKKFKNYWDATGSCHIAAKWAPCDQDQLYYEWYGKFHL